MRDLRTPCECGDTACPVGHARHGCTEEALNILYRIDMADETGTAFCHGCGDDAYDSGLFTSEAGQG